MSQRFYSATDLAKLMCMPGTTQSVTKAAKRDGWADKAVKRVGHGGGRVWVLSDLPKAAREEILSLQIQNLTPTAATSAGAVPVAATGSLPVKQPATTVLTKDSSSGVSTVTGTASTQLALERLNAAENPAYMTAHQREVSMARMVLLDAAEELVRAGHSHNKAFALIAHGASTGSLKPVLMRLIPVANARGEELSARTLKRWYDWVSVADQSRPSARLAALAPKVPKPNVDYPDDVMGVIGFLPAARKNLKEAVRKYARKYSFIHEHRAIDQLYHRAKRAKGSMPQSVLHQLMHTGAALTAKKPFITRSTDDMLPTDVYVIDGHSMKAKWAHPETGKPFVPEFTAVEDWATRKVVGWSVSLSENALAVREAHLNAIRDFGVPNITYSDGGSGQTAKDMDDPQRGFYATFGIEHHIGRPGNPQGRGVIERAWASHAMLVAQENPLYRGHGNDPDTLRRNTIALDKTLRALKRDPSNIIPIKQLPSFTQLIDALTGAVAEYNARPHRGLPKNVTTGLHFSPNEFWLHLAQDPTYNPRLISLGSEQLMFMPYQLVPAKRGRVTLFNRYYGHADLYTLADGKHVRVHYDVTDPRNVWIADLEGQFLCQAGMNADTRDAFPMSVIEQARLRRIDNQAKRLQAKADDLAEERAGILSYSAEAFARPDLPEIEIDETPVTHDSEPQTDCGDAGHGEGGLVRRLTPVEVDGALFQRPARFVDQLEKYRWLMTNKPAITNDDDAWLRKFVESNLYRDVQDLLVREGLGWRVDSGVGDEVFRGAVA